METGKQRKPESIELIRSKPLNWKDLEQWLDDDDAGPMQKKCGERKTIYGVSEGRAVTFYHYWQDAASSKLILTPPGYRLTSIAQFLLTRKAYKRFVEPVIADMQEEYVDELAAGHIWHARWIALRGHLLVIPGWLYAFVTGKLAALLRRSR